MITNIMGEQSGRSEAFVKLGEFLRDFTGDHPKDGRWTEKFRQTLELAGHQNGWFTQDSMKQALAAWGENLRREKLEKWLSSYSLAEDTSQTVAIIMAGNIPLVGFHDFLAVLLSGNKVKAKLSSSDRLLLPLLANYLVEEEPALESCITFVEGQLKDYDAVIATGSNNSARYFEHYFASKPHIIRRNRNSVAILNGTETPAQLKALGNDIFDYFGLGCRSVSKLFVPEGYAWDKFYPAMEPYKEVMDHQKYANNYDYNKAVYLMSDFPILDNGFLLLKEDTAYASPIGTLFYETYADEKVLLDRLEKDRDLIQCVVGPPRFPGAIPYGTSQAPALWDYADGVDTLEFLSQLNNNKHQNTYEKT